MSIIANKLMTLGAIKANDIGIPKINVTDGTISTIATIIFIFAGGLGLLFVLIGALRYVGSQGDAKQVAQAKNTIIYALIGMILAASAFGIVQFLLGRIL